ncbi:MULTISPECIES: CAP-associated domain-containing protein [Staphylococcus]|uniref:CAP-associated domain-containing protein n=1 Tax=Staphylococcus TaxID=1279 RepID=UPI000DF7BC85|nr:MULTISPECIES: CAP domain-containing protein [unclassified Staphylococcus]UXV34255.1 CAP domain-containing protein [Staphylococcus sp. IVB6181]
MRNLIIKVVGVLLLITFLIYLFYSPRLKFDVLENPNKKTPTKTEQTQKKVEQAENPKPKSGIGTWVNNDISGLTKKFGQADRVYEYYDDYKNYVFRENNQYYIVTTKNNIIKSVYATGTKADIEPIKISEDASSIFENTSINPEPTVNANGKQYDLELSDEDMKTQMLIKYGNTYAQVYIDQQTNKVVGVRFLDAEALVMFNPYQMTKSSDEKTIENKHKNVPYEQNVNQLMTLYEVTNQIRHLKGLKPFKVNNDLSHIASVNLYESTNNKNVEFTEGALKQQLDDRDIKFKSVGQNVGYDFNDVPTLLHSWLNSDIHRSRILNTQYTEMGGDVMDGYYTLIFIEE